eukprot:PITA_30110
MTGDKEKLESYTALEKGKKVTFENDTPAAIKGKGTAQLKEKVKAGNVLKNNDKGRRTPNNLYIFEEGHKQCYLAQDDEHWLWNRTIGTSKLFTNKESMQIPDSSWSSRHQNSKQHHMKIMSVWMVWLGLMKHKDETFEKFKSFKALVENESDYKIKCLRSDGGGQFTSNEFFDFCEEQGIRRELSTARTPQQNEVVERMNRTVQQMARAMLDESGTPATFWDEAAFAVVIILNKTNVRVNNIQTPHELWYGETPSVKHFKNFGSKCYIKNTDEQLGKLEPRADEGILHWLFSLTGTAYKWLYKTWKNLFDSIDVVVDEKGYIPRQVNYENIEEDEDYPQNQTNDEEETHEEETHEELEEQIRIEEKTPSKYVQKNHPESQISGQKEVGVQERRTTAEASSYLALLSSTEPQNVKEACKDECWVKEMHEELE